MTTWPSWRYGPGGQAKVCASEADVPEGWVAHASGVHPLDHDADGKKGGAKPKRTLRDRLKGG
jgi:hypothetical protein